MTWVFSALTIVMVLTTMIFNYFKMRVSYLVFGTLFLVLCVFMSSMNGRTFRDSQGLI